MRSLYWSLPCLSFLLIACSDDASTPSNNGAGGEAGADAAPPDSAAAEAASEASLDSSNPTDASTDAGESDSSDGAVLPDASETGVDGSIDAPDDGSSVWQEPAGNIIVNGGFEVWTGDVPQAWLGNTSTVDTSLVTKSTDTSHGPFALRVGNPSDDHVRLSTAPQSVKAGRYDCTYRVKGHGQIRNAHYHGTSGNGFSSYQPSGYHTIQGDWQTVAYQLTLPVDVDGVFELIFSIRSTDPAQGDLVIDDVACVRQPSPCDTQPCGSWAQCDVVTGACDPLPGLCGDASDCWSWETCNASHVCELQPGKCGQTADCAGTPATPVCDPATHTCIAGDPCAGVSCPTWQVCDPKQGKCVLAEGACATTADCLQAKPACDKASHLCQPVEHASNMVPNGGFEQWGDDGYGHQIPLYWMGTDFGSDNTGANEIPPSKVLPYATSVHSGALACQLVQTGIAERFTSEGFALPVGTYTCAYWVRGHGQIRHRVYSKAGWSTYVDFVPIDSADWVQQTFKLQGNTTQVRLIFYASYTQTDRDHIQIDDVVCTRD
mgnify:FL=1